MRSFRLRGYKFTYPRPAEYFPGYRLRKIRFHGYVVQQTNVILATRIHGPVQYLHFLQCVLSDSQFVCHTLF